MSTPEAMTAHLVIRSRHSALLLVVFTFAILLASCSKDSNPVAPPTSEYQPMEDRVLALVNTHRASLGLGALTMMDAIRTQARNHSTNMSNGSVAFGHDGFQARVDAIKTSIPLSAAGENVAWNQGFSDPTQTAIDGWLNSPGHKANIEGDYNATGIGVMKSSDGKYYFTQIFIKKL